MPDSTQAAERPGEADATATAPQSCLFCGTPVPKARRGGTRMFCTDRHRAAYRDQQVQAAVLGAMDAVLETTSELARLQARLEGALTLLERYGKKTVQHRAG